MTARNLPELPTRSILTAGVLSLLLLPTRLNILQHGCTVSCGQLSCMSSVLKHTEGQQTLLLKESNRRHVHYLSGCEHICEAAALRRSHVAT